MRGVTVYEVGPEIRMSLSLLKMACIGFRFVSYEKHQLLSKHNFYIGNKKKNNSAFTTKQERVEIILLKI